MYVHQVFFGFRVGVTLTGVGAIARTLARAANKGALLGGNTADGVLHVEEGLRLYNTLASNSSAKDLADLNNSLVAVTYVAGNTVTIADLLLFTAVHSEVRYQLHTKHHKHTSNYKTQTTKHKRNSKYKTKTTKNHKHNSKYSTHTQSKTTK